ncbi:hypothetical protein [Actinokineospora terrae]|uniref:Uncharacterized protein n=1 Tax=Actinokineospora terrae TaxID=155974 RepID=A0A1H9XSR7_9PSEU|nr:hypothetical protein [Actinokineospora terrae]SES49089.1 hypothetical protein SAMN04487818_12421 [Actinokineospora terrae]
MSTPLQDPEARLYARQQLAVRGAVDTAQDAWSRLSMADLDGSWEQDVRPRVVIATEEAQITAAAIAAPYVTAALAAAAAVSAPMGRLVAQAFAGYAANGMPLRVLMDQVLAWLRRALVLGMPVSDARTLGLSRLLTYVATEVGDTGRAAVQAAMITEPAVAGYERVVRLPACGRCVILAGRLYRVSDGFLRHPRCDCQMRPVTREQWEHDDRGNSPTALFDRMTESEQDRAFGKGDAAAIRAGADMARVVNARRKGAVYIAGGHAFTREATTVRGIGRQLGDTATRPGARYRSSGIARPTAAQLVHSSDNRAELIAELRRYGYLRTESLATTSV